jgi:hypothetical protein
MALFTPTYASPNAVRHQCCEEGRQDSLPLAGQDRVIGGTIGHGVLR